MAPKVSKKFKTKAKKNTASSSSPIQFDRVRIFTARIEEIFESLTQFRSIWGERQIALDELDPSICRNLESRNWLSLCDVSHPSPTALIREFYSNLSIEFDYTSTHFF